MPKNELPLVICYLSAAAGLVWFLHIIGETARGGFVLMAAATV